MTGPPADPTAEATGSPRGALAVTGAAGLLGSTLLALVGNSGSAHPAHVYWPWVPPLAAGHLGLAASLRWCRVGLALLVLAWMALGWLVHTRAVRPRQVAAVAAVWAAPLLLAPPLFSDDAFSYAASGALQTHGWDPYLVGPVRLAGLGLTNAVSPTWLRTASPYGPGFLLLTRAVASVSGQGIVAITLIRLVAVAAVAACAVAGLRLSSRIGAPAAVVLWAGIANPLLLVDSVSGGHNDALMTALLLGGFVLHRRGHRYLALLLTVAGAQVKVLALAGTVVLVLDGTPRGPLSCALRRCARPALVAAAMFVAVTTVCGLPLGHGVLGGWGWVPALGVPARVLNATTPLDALWDLAPGLHLTHLSHGREHALPPSHQTGLLVLRLAAQGTTAAVAAALAVRVGRLGPERTAGLILLATAGLGVVLWPWYLVAPLVLIPLAGSTAERRVVLVLSVVLLWAYAPGGAQLWGNPHHWPGRFAADIGTLLVAASLSAVVVTSHQRPTRVVTRGP